MKSHDKDTCPHCKSGAFTSRFKVLCLSGDEWPGVLIIFGFTLVFGQLLNLSPTSAALFAVFGCIPLLAFIEDRLHCLRCGADFTQNSPAKLAVGTPPDAKKS